jgi:hypothetical protein
MLVPEEVPGVSILRGAISPQLICGIRAMLVARAQAEELESGVVPAQDQVCFFPERSGYWNLYSEIQALEELHTVGWDPQLLDAIRHQGIGKPYSHPRRIVTFHAPGFHVPPYQDFLSVQGTWNSFVIYVPLEDRDEHAVVRATKTEGGIRLLPHNLSAAGCRIDADAMNSPWWDIPTKTGDAVCIHALVPRAFSVNSAMRTLFTLEYRFQDRRDPICRHALRPHHFPRVPKWSVLTNDWSTRDWVRPPRFPRIVPFVLPDRVEQWHLAFPSLLQAPRSRT